jgi:NADH:ubiquinone oxidoreductase subunit E
MSHEHNAASDPPVAGRLLESLKQVQQDQGWLPRQAMEDLAREMDLSLGQVYGVATFYSFLSPAPLGRHVIRVCHSLPCLLGEADLVLQTLEEKWSLLPGDTTDDGRFSLALTSCIGACDQAPAMLVDNQVYGNLTPNRIDEILRSLD